MGRLIVIIMLLLLIASRSQTYSLFQPNSVPYFTSQDHYLKGIRVDSLKTINNEIHYFLYHTPRGSYQTMYAILDTNGGSWMGKEVIELQDGITFIPTLWNDTVIIRTQAGLNESWRFYDDTSQNYYEITVTRYDTATISGVLDSLKILTIAAYNSVGLNNNDSINNKQIILSKHNGIFQTFALYSFPFPNPFVGARMDYYMDETESIPIINGRKHIQVFKRLQAVNPTTFDLYNFDPNDVFQYEINAYLANGGYKEDSIIAKNFIGVNQIEYTIRTKEKLRDNYNQWVSKSYVKALYVNYAFEKWFNNNLMPDEWGSSYFITYDPIDTSRCFVSPYYFMTYNNIIQEGRVNNFEPIIDIKGYKIGFGKVTEGYYTKVSTTGNASIDMVYSFKNGNHCGYKHVLGINKVSLEKLINIYPNPVQDNLSIVTPLNNYKAIIYDRIGREVMRINDLYKDAEISLVDLSDGVYILKIYSQEPAGTISKKIIVQH